MGGTKLKRFDGPIGLVPNLHRAKNAPDSLLDFISALISEHAKTLAIGVAFSANTAIALTRLPMKQTA
jgi:hypothetical protein